MRHIGIAILIILVHVQRGDSQTCNPAHNRQLVNGTCVCMAGYYDAGPTNCPSCNTPCLTCVTTATTCTGCNSALFLTLSGTTCICMDGYVMVSGVCQPCHYSCKTCSGLLSTNCITCDTAVRMFVSNTCICLNTTYDNSTLQSCQSCNAKCLWCTASTSNDCTNCDSNLLRVIGTSNPGPCLCYNGFYDTGAALCQPCHYSCVTCTIAATTCLTCDTTNNYRSLSGTSCACISHYYDSGTATCSLCSARCGNCTVSADQCLTCNSTLRVLTGTTCPCISGYYQDSATITCLACTNYCKTCVNASSTCLSCYNYGNRLLYNATCGCITGYYDNGTIFCTQCPYYCYTCTGPDPPTCTSCSTSAHRTLSTGGCPCDSGYYDDGSSVTCLPCSYTCQTCSLSSTLCTSCDSSAHRTQLATDCQCDIGYYDNGVSELCVACHYSCVSCFGGSGSQCYTCQPNRDYTNYSCPCFSGMYQLSQLCYACDSICATCTGSATNCLSCPISRTLSNNTCICANGYYASGSSCVACSIQCGTCVSSSTTCLSCNPLFGTVLSGSSCVCVDGWYKNASTLVCMQCHYSCGTCVSGGMYDCSACNTSAHRTLSINACVCDVGYYDSGVGEQCMGCHSNCVSCVGASDYNCTACASGYVLIGSYCKYNTTCLNYLYDNNCINTCPTSTYGTSSSGINICVPCSNGCLTCTSSTYCLSCMPNLTYNQTAHTCISYCPIGYYIDSYYACTPCPSTCTSCIMNSSSKIVCVQCGTGYVKQDSGSCVSVCSSGYLLVGTLCHRCPSNCRICTSLATNGCSACVSGFHMLMGACHTVCPLGYTPTTTNTQSQCTPCPSQCATCMLNRCLSCSMGYYLDYTSTCVPLYHLLLSDGSISKCHPNCKSCTNTSFSSCIMCQSLRGDHVQMAVSGYCQCKMGTVDTGNGTCDTQTYQSIVRSTQVLVGATQSTVFLSVIVSILSTNFVLMLGIGNYLQSYSMMYFLNSSAVMQTDIVLQQYYNINPIYYYRMQTNSTLANTRLLLSTQTDQSLFYRGKHWQYLSDWAFMALAANIIIWGIPIILNICLCCCCRYNKINNTYNTDNKQQNIPHNLQPANGADTSKRCACVSNFCRKHFHRIFKYPFGFYIRQFLSMYNQSVAIIFYMITYSQVSLYAVFSFKTLFNMQIQQSSFKIDYISLTLSAIIVLYYVVYLLRLMIGCARAKMQTQSKDQPSPLRLLFHMYRKNARKKLNKIFLPLLMLRNIGISILIVLLAYNPVLQSGTCLSLVIFYMLLNFCICPYPGIMRAYFHFSDFFLVLQIGLLTYTTWLPEQSRIGTSKALIAINFIQIGLAVAIALWIAITLTNKNICQKNKIKKSNKVISEKDIQKNIRHQSSMSSLNPQKLQQQEKEHKVVFYDMQNVDDHITSKQNKSPMEPINSQNTQKLSDQTRKLHQTINESSLTEKVVKKKYRVKHKK